MCIDSEFMTLLREQIENLPTLILQHLKTHTNEQNSQSRIQKTKDILTSIKDRIYFKGTPKNNKPAKTSVARL